MNLVTLNEVLTLSEAAEMWCVDPSTIRHAIGNNRFSSDEVRKSCSTWLIVYEAMARIFGDIEPEEVMQKVDVYTIGYEGKSIDQFIQILKDNEINTILDVRAVPISRKKGFSKNPLSEHLELNGIDYKPYQTLGTPKELRTELSETKDYFTFFNKYEEWLRRRPFAFERLQSEVADNPQKKCCLMCFEKDPNECHRSIIAKNLINKTDEISEVINL